MKTIKLLDHQERPERASDILSAAVVIGILLFARAALNGPHTEAQTISQPTVLPPILIIATAPAVIVPTAIPVTPQVVFITLPTPPPEVVYVEAAPEVIYVEAPAPAVATPEPEPPALQTFAQPADEEPLSPALMREAMDR